MGRMVVLASFAWQSIRGRFGVGHLKMGSYATWSLPSGVHLEDKNINMKLFKTWVTCNCILNGRSKAYILVALMFHFTVLTRVPGFAYRLFMKGMNVATLPWHGWQRKDGGGW